MFGMTKLARNHLALGMSLQNLLSPNDQIIFMIKVFLTTNSLTPKASNFAFIWVKTKFPKIEWQIIPQMPNQPLASKTFYLQNFCNFLHMWFSFPEIQRCRGFVNLTLYAKNEFMEKLKIKFKMN
jgi:hypothetical protein